MFVRAHWRLKRLIDLKQTLREMEVPSSRNADILGISGPDFSKWPAASSTAPRARRLQQPPRGRRLPFLKFR